MLATPALAQDLKLPRQKIELVAPPFVHPHEQATRQAPKIVEFRMEIVEKEVVIDEQGTKFQAMTFNGSMPGPMMVVHQGDYVELTLVNPDTNTMPHNIDFHSATGALGGGALTLINPGEQVVLRWKADRTGVFVYHCAPEGSMIPWHVVSGMHGTVMVLPREGLKDGAGKPLRYDRVYYIGEHDLYVPRDENGKYKSYDSLGESYGGHHGADAQADPDPRGVQRQGRRADRQERHDGECRRDRADRAFAGEPRLAAAPDRRARRPCVGDRQVREPARDRSGDLVHPRRIGGRGALHVQAARHLRLREPQSDRGGRARRRRALQGRGQVERRPDDPGEGAGTDPAQGAGRIADRRSSRTEAAAARAKRRAASFPFGEALPCCSHQTSRWSCWRRCRIRRPAGDDGGPSGRGRSAGRRSPGAGRAAARHVPLSRGRRFHPRRQARRGAADDGPHRAARSPSCGTR